MTFEKVREDMAHLYAKLAQREGKYVRDMNRFMNNGVRREDIWQMSSAPLAYVNPAQGVDGVQTQLNLCKSIPDTIVSKISQANVRPLFTPANGSFDTTEACKMAQHFFDLWLDEQHAYPKSVMCFRDAAVCDMGVMHVDPFSTSIQRIAPWEYFVDPAEYYHGTVTRAMYFRKFYPLAGIIGQTDNKELKKIYEDDPHKKGKFAIYYDLYQGKVWRVFNGEQVEDPVALEFEQYGGLYRRPFVEMFYTRPMRGFYSTSLVDDLYPIQRQVDELVRRMDQATRLGVMSMIMIPNGSGIKASNVENGVRAYNYQGGADGGKADVLTPPALNAQYPELLDRYISYAHELTGISQLSAQSKKPSGLDSGKALETMEDIESDRFNTQLQQFSHFLVDVTRVGIDCFRPNQSILPKDVGRAKMTWGELRKQRDLFTIQFSAASALSKDPEQKRNEIQFLLDQRVIEPSSVAQFYQMPDLEGVYTLATSAIEYVERIISNAIKTGEIEYAGTVDLMLLKSKALSKLNQLNAADDDSIYIDRVVELLNKVLLDIKNVAILSNPQDAPPPPPPSTMALDAGQMKALSDIAIAVTQGLPRDSALAVAKISFPSVDESLLNAVIDGAMPAPEMAGAPNAQAMTPAPQGAVA